VYIASIQTVAKNIDELCSRLGNVPGAQGERMRITMTNIAEDFSAAGHGPEYIAPILYAGETWMLRKRSDFDTLHFGFRGTPSRDCRQPLIVAETIAARAKTKRDCSFVTLDPKGAYMNRHKQ
jgi:hypothetical protein